MHSGPIAKEAWLNVRVLAICQDELVIRSLDDVLLPTFEVDFLVESRPLARRLHDAGIHAIAGDPRRIDTYLKADISPSTCFIIEDNGRKSVKKTVSAIRDAGGTLIYIVHTGPRSTKAAEAARAATPDVTHMDLAELIRPTLITELSRSMTRARVQQYQRYLADADRILSESLEIFEQSLGSNHQAYASALGVQAEVLMDLRRYNEAIAARRRAIEIIQRRFGEAPYTSGVEVAKLAQIYARKGEYAVADSLFHRALANLAIYRPATHLDFRQVHGTMAERYRLEGKRAEAERYARLAQQR